MSNLNCHFYNNKKCILKEQANLPNFKEEHDCSGLINKCSFFIKEKVKQISIDSHIKILIKQVSNPYLVKADGLVYPANNRLEIDDKTLNKMTFNQAQKKCNQLLKNGVKMGYSYIFPCEEDWKIKQKYFINAVVAGESRLVNEGDVAGGMKKSLLIADEMGLTSLLIIPCDNGTHDISLISMTQLSSIFVLCQKHKFENLKNIYICMEDEESESVFIEYYNRIFNINDSKAV